MDTYAQMHTRVKLLGDADVNHTQTIGEDTVKLLAGYIPPRVSAPLIETQSIRHIALCYANQRQ